MAQSYNNKTGSLCGLPVSAILTPLGHLALVEPAVLEVGVPAAGLVVARDVRTRGAVPGLVQRHALGQAGEEDHREPVGTDALRFLDQLDALLLVHFAALLLVELAELRVEEVLLELVHRPAWREV